MRAWASSSAATRSMASRSGDEEYLDLLVLVELLSALETATLRYEGVEGVGHEGWVRGEVPDREHHLGRITRLLDEFAGDRERRVLAFLHGAAGKLEAESSRAVAILADHDELAAFGGIDHRYDAGPVEAVDEVEGTALALGRFALARTDPEDPAVGYGTRR